MSIPGLPWISYDFIMNQEVHRQTLTSALASASLMRRSRTSRSMLAAATCRIFSSSPANVWKKLTLHIYRLMDVIDVIDML